MAFAGFVNDCNDLVLVEVSRDPDDALDEDHEAEQDPVHGDHPLALAGNAAAAENRDEDDQGAGQDDHEAGDLVHSVGEEGEELAPVNEAPETNTEATQAKQQQKDVVAVEAKLEAGEGEARARGRAPLVWAISQPRPVIAVVRDGHTRWH